MPFFLFVIGDGAGAGAIRKSRGDETIVTHDSIVSVRVQANGVGRISVECVVRDSRVRAGDFDSIQPRVRNVAPLDLYIRRGNQNLVRVDARIDLTVYDMVEVATGHDVDSDVIGRSAEDSFIYAEATPVRIDSIVPSPTSGSCLDHEITKVNPRPSDVNRMVDIFAVEDRVSHALSLHVDIRLGDVSKGICPVADKD